ncbi:MAG: GyrI-like domain-containing protein [Tepidisphaeraceae bacterium]|jgi:AraC family transcriptional regulator
MTPKFIELPEKKIVGLGTKFISILFPGGNSMNVIPPLWGKFMSQIGAVQHRVGQAVLGVVEPLSAQGEFFYIAAAEVSDFSGTPKDMLQRTIPAGRYASFTHKGKLETLRDTMRGIYSDWLPKSGCRRRKAPDLEIYDHRFAIGSDQSEFDILIPVEAEHA